MDVTDAESQAKLDSVSDQCEGQLSLDIGVSLIKLVYITRNNDSSIDDDNGSIDCPVLGGKLHFAKFETSKMNDCLEFIKKLRIRGLRHPEAPPCDKTLIKVTGVGAYKYADLIKEKLGVRLEKEDEMDCIVTGANFLLKAVHQEAFTYMDGHKEFVQIDHNDMYPFLLVNIGSSVSMIKVDGDGKFEYISGTSVDGGTFWGLGRLLTKCKSFDELLELSHRGNSSVIDMLLGDVYGGLDYSKIGLPSTAIASYFGKAISDNKELEDYKPEDVAQSLLRMISYEIGWIAHLNALRFGLKRIFFGGFFICGHAYTMDTISFAITAWGTGEAKAMFLRHEGYLGALGAFMSYEKHGLDDLMAHQLFQRFLFSAPYAGNKNFTRLNEDSKDNELVECDVYVREDENQGEIEADQSKSQISHLALDIGGSLIKLVYFLRNNDSSIDENGRNHGGRLHFAKFETSKMNDCIEFISSKKLQRGGLQHPKGRPSDKTLIKATGGGAFKFADLITEKLDVDLEKEDEIDCQVSGAKFLLKAVHQEAFTYINGQRGFVQIDDNDLYPFLLVNIGSGVSMFKVDGNGMLVGGTSAGGGTFWGLGRLLTKCKSFVELMELCHRGNNRVLDMVVEDIYGGLDYSKIGLSPTTIVSSFGKATSDNRELEDYKPEDVARSLLRMISNHIGQIAFLYALQFGIKRIFFGGSFICGHASMDTLSDAVHFWSKGEAKAMFLRHEGFVGALGAFMSYENHGLDDLIANQLG